MRFSVVLLCHLASVAILSPHANAARPNIVFIYPDDMRWDAMGVVQREQGERARFPWLRTPHFDRLAANGVRFRESFVATSLCSPGRANVMTGQHGHLNGVINNYTPLPATAVTFAQHLQTAGYTTAYVGKWHMYQQRERPHYDYVASFVGQGRYNDCPVLINGVETLTKGWIDDVSTEYATRFIAQQPTEKPFFLWLGFKSPHVPRGGTNLPEPFRSLYANEVSRPTPNTSLKAIYNRTGAGDSGAKKTDPMLQRAANDRDYFRHIAAIDACVGRVLDELERTAKIENTIVILASDNGYYSGEHGVGDKRTAYDESLRVPLIVRLPGRARVARTSDAFVVNLDYASTILDYAGAKPLPLTHGRSLRPVIEGATPQDWRTAFFYEYFEEPQYTTPGVLAVRTTTHKLVVYPGHEDWTEVFDLQADPYETKNLANDRSLRAQLQARFDAEAKAVAFRWPPGYGPNGEIPPPAPGTENSGNRKQKE